VIARGHHGGGEAEHKTVEGEVVETAAQQGEGVIGFVAAFTVPAVEIFQRQRIMGCLCDINRLRLARGDLAPEADHPGHQ
jgi:hypothetical protein